MDEIDMMIMTVIQKRPNWDYSTRNISRRIEEEFNVEISSRKIAAHVTHIEAEIRIDDLGRESPFRIRIRIKEIRP